MSPPDLLLNAVLKQRPLRLEVLNRLGLTQELSPKLLQTHNVILYLLLPETRIALVHFPIPFDSPLYVLVPQQHLAVDHFEVHRQGFIVPEFVHIVGLAHVYLHCLLVHPTHAID